MNLNVYDFRKKADVRQAIDLLNHLIADCMVSESWIRMHVTVPFYLKDAIGLDGQPVRDNKEILEDATRDMLYIREKIVKYWLCLHDGLHRAIYERVPSDQTHTYFNLMWSLFDLNRMKLLGFLENTPNPDGQCASLRKQWYNQQHYCIKDRPEEDPTTPR